MPVLSKREVLIVATATLATPNAAGQAAIPKRPYRRIATEEGFTLPEIDVMVPAALYPATKGAGTPNNPAIRKAFRKVTRAPGGRRFAAMDAVGPETALLPLCLPGLENFPAAQVKELAQLANDRVASAVRAHPARFAALATARPFRIGGEA